jgi:protein SCO1/2
MVSVCIDPERDTVESMKAYAEAYEARPGWTFATGTQRDVDLIRRALGVYNPDDAADRVRSNHTGMLIGVNDPAGRNINVPTALRVELLEDMVRRLAALPKLDRL